MNGFRKSTIYQIYIKSFADSNGDGIGDLNGIREKLPYLKDLGIDYIWVTPFFRSPMRDNGYDISDYYSVNPVFGTMEDAVNLIREAGELGIGMMFDMVFNHSSTEHEWFQRALRGEKRYMDYYIFRDPVSGGAPCNWQSKFGGSAWEYVPSLGKYYLHLFDRTQADLNWENPELREELRKIILFWKEKGLRGFRFDVVNLISKPEEFPDDEEGDGRRFYTDGRHVHRFLKELVQKTGIDGMVTVGEMSSTSIENCILYTRPSEKELSMCFSFHHLKVDYKDGNKWALMAPDLRELRRLFSEWQEKMQEGGGWNALFWCNHDQPRVLSRFGDEGKYWKQSAKMLAIFIHLMRGTPYVYQGEELGMTNPGYQRIEDYRDVESINYYGILRKDGHSREDALRILAARSRDDSRTPMQWDGGKYAGFSKEEPWIAVPENHSFINAASEEADEDSILHCYRELILFRKKLPLISEGRIHFTDSGNEKVLSYERSLGKERLLVFGSFSAEEERAEGIPSWEEGWELLIGNYPEDGRKDGKLRPYEAAAFLRKGES